MLVGIDGDSTRLIGFPLTDLLSLGSKKKNSRSYWGELTLSRCKNSQCQSKEGGGKAARDHARNFYLRPCLLKIGYKVRLFPVHRRDSYLMNARRSGIDHPEIAVSDFVFTHFFFFQKSVLFVCSRNSRLVSCRLQCGYL